MIIDALRRLVVRWLDRPATSVPPQVDPSEDLRNRIGVAGYTVISGNDLEKLLGGNDLEKLLGHSEEKEITSEYESWELWEQGIDDNFMEGWSNCRFAIRGRGVINVRWVYGNTNRAFGIYRAEMLVCTADDERVRRHVAGLVHLRSGITLALFDNVIGAAAASELALRTCPWETITTADFDPAGIRTWQAWVGIGMVPIPDCHAHDGDSILPILAMDEASILTGKPEKPS